MSQCIPQVHWNTHVWKLPLLNSCMGTGSFISTHTQQTELIRTQNHDDTDVHLLSLSKLISSGLSSKRMALASTHWLLVSVSWRQVFWCRMHMWCYWQWLRPGRVKKSRRGHAATTAGRWLLISGPSLGKHTTQTSAPSFRKGGPSLVVHCHIIFHWTKGAGRDEQAMQAAGDGVNQPSKHTHTHSWAWGFSKPHSCSEQLSNWLFIDFTEMLMRYDHIDSLPLYKLNIIN